MLWMDYFDYQTKYVFIEIEEQCFNHFKLLLRVASIGAKIAALLPFSEIFTNVYFLNLGFE